MAAHRSHRKAFVQSRAFPVAWATGCGVRTKSSVRAGSAVCGIDRRLSWAQQELVTDIEIHGNRRIPADTIKARIFTHAGDVYDPAALERDFNSLWNTGYFEDIRFEREQTPKGWRIHIYVKEKPTIREINYTGLNSVSTSDVLDRFKERKVGLCRWRANTIPPR